MGMAILKRLISLILECLRTEFLMEKGQSSIETEKPFSANLETDKELLVNIQCQMEAFMMANMKTEFPMDLDNSDGVME